MSEPATKPTIVPACREDTDLLTEISFASKKYWNYPEEYFTIWQKELTITQEYINTNVVFKCCQDGNVLSYYSLVYLQEDFSFQGERLSWGWYLDHMFIRPSHIRKGIGTKLFQHLVQYCRKNRIDRFGILSDPYSKGFYLEMGCQYIKEFPSSIPGRTTPYLVRMV